MHYNERLADQQGLTAEEREALDLTYDLLFDVLQNPERYDGVEDRVRSLEFRLQAEWKFPQDPKFHRYQTHIKGCACPKLDNAELVGCDASRYRTSDCPWHWTQEDRDYYASERSQALRPWMQDKSTWEGGLK